MKKTILIVDDEPLTRNALVRILSGKYDCLTAADGDLALKALDENDGVALMLTDYKMPGMNGIDLISAAKAKRPSLATVIVTAFSDVSLAVEAMKRGADDFTTKPITDLDKLEDTLAEAIRKHTAPAEADGGGRADRPRGFTGESAAMAEVYRRIHRVAPSSASVLIEGPSGTGKELVARAIHDLSPRANGPFVAVECAALPASLIEAELFGSEKGSFTSSIERRIGKFEAASGGTLFLDEIGEIDLPNQVKLLRAIESRKIQRVGSNADISVDFRLIAATNRDLAAMVAEKTFREDLYYRLNVIDIKMPPLKSRPGDIALLVKKFLGEFSKANGKSVTGISRDALARLETYDWPGNVRQLRNIIERMVVLSAGGELSLDDVPDEITAAKPAPTAEPVVSNPAAARSAAAESETLADTEKRQILAALAAAGNNKSKAALNLGISRRTLHRKLHEWQIET